MHKYYGRVELQVECKGCKTYQTFMSFFNGFQEPRDWPHACSGKYQRAAGDDEEYEGVFNDSGPGSRWKFNSTGEGRGYFDEMRDTGDFHERLRRAHEEYDRRQRNRTYGFGGKTKKR